MPKLILFILSLIFLTFSKVSYSAESCESATLPKTHLNIEFSLKNRFGDQAYQYRLAAAELLANYGTSKQKNLQIQPKMEVYLSAIVNDKLNEQQYRSLDDYTNYLNDVLVKSKLVVREQQNKNYNTDSPPQSVIDTLEGVLKESYFNKLRPKIVIPFSHTHQMMDQLSLYKESERWALIKQSLAKETFLSPKEMIDLCSILPATDQSKAFDFLVTKVVGRFDFIPLAEFKNTKLSNLVILKMAAHSGSQWPLESFIQYVSKNFDIKNSDKSIWKSLASIYSPDSILAYLNDPKSSQLELPEAELVLVMLIANLKQSDIKDIQAHFTLVSNKLYHASDRQAIEEILKTLNLRDKDNELCKTKNNSRSAIYLWCASPLALAASMYISVTSQIDAHTEKTETSVSAIMVESPLVESKPEFNDGAREIRTNDLVFYKDQLRKVHAVTVDNKILLAEDSYNHATPTDVAHITAAVKSYKDLSVGAKVIYKGDHIRTIEAISNNGKVALEQDKYSYRSFTVVDQITKTVDAVQGLKVKDKVLYDGHEREIEYLGKNGTVVLKEDSFRYRSFVDAKEVSLIKK